MGYTAFSVTFGEVPTAAKWNYLGTNDESFNDGTGIADDAIIQRHFADNSVGVDQLSSALLPYKELGRDTLASLGTQLEVIFTPKKYILVIVGLIANASGLDGWFKFNSDTGANYAERYSTNHGVDTTGVSATQLDVEVGNAIADASYFAIMDLYNPSNGDKLGQHYSVFQTALTAATAPTFSDMQYSWNNTAQVHTINLTTDQQMKIGSELIVLGHD